MKNRTANGVQLKLMHKADIPERIHFYDDSLGCLSLLLVIWRKPNEIGCKVLQAGQSRTSLTRPAKEPIYAMP